MRKSLNYKDKNINWGILWTKGLCLPHPTSKIRVLKLLGIWRWSPFLKIFIYLLSCVRSWLWHVRSFVAAHRLSSCAVWA